MHFIWSEIRRLKSNMWSRSSLFHRPYCLLSFMFPHDVHKQCLRIEPMPMICTAPSSTVWNYDNLGCAKVKETINRIIKKNFKTRRRIVYWYNGREKKSMWCVNGIGPFSVIVITELKEITCRSRSFTCSFLIVSFVFKHAVHVQKNR